MNLARQNIAATNARRDGIVDFNIHDLIGIRLINPSAHDARVVERHLGLSPAGFPGNPALTINYVDRLDEDQPLRFLGRDDVAFTDDDFIILRSGDLARARTRLAMDQIGGNCQIECETGLPAIPLLRQLINLAMLARGIVPVHAAAFSYQGRGVLVTGWSHGSKTGTLLAFMAAGGKFVGDEWIYFSVERDRMFGLPDQLEARPWYLGDLPQYQRRVSLSDRVRTRMTAGFAHMLGPLIPRVERTNSLATKAIRYARQSLLDQQSIPLRPIDLFGKDACVLSSPLDLVIVTVSHAANALQVTPVTLDRVAGQMANSFVHEQASLMACYRKHLFAFPDRRNPLLDSVEQVYRERAFEGLQGKLAYTMQHPYPVGTTALRGAVEPLITASGPFS